MSSIYMNGRLVQSLSYGFKNNIYKLENNCSNVTGIRNSVDYRIGSRSNINGRFNIVISRMTTVKSRLREIDSFVDNAVMRYSSNEDTIEKKADSLQFNAIIKGVKAVLEYPLSFFSKLDSNKLLIAGKDLRFTMFKKNGNTYIKIGNGAINNLADFQKYRNLMTKYLGGTAKWNRSFMEQLANAGVMLYGKRGGSYGYYTSNINKLLNTNFKGLNDAITNLTNPDSKLKKALKTLGKEMDIFADFKEWGKASNLTKLGKGLGIAGTALTIFNNAFDKDLSTKEKVINTGIDIASGTAAMAIGAAAGSFILPPAGTVVGAGVGLVANFVMNFPIGGNSLVGHTKDFANQLYDDIASSDFGKSVGNTINNIGKNISKIFW